MQGGVVQGIGWALNEEYIYDAKGRMENAGFLDYRIPVASDLPMIETVAGRGAEPEPPVRRARASARSTSCPPMAAIANAIERRDRPAADRAADVAAEAARRHRCAGAGVEGRAGRGKRRWCIRRRASRGRNCRRLQRLDRIPIGSIGMRSRFC